MITQQIITMLENRRMNLTSQKTSSERLGDFAQVEQLDIQIQEIELLLVKLKSTDT